MSAPVRGRGIPVVQTHDHRNNNNNNNNNNNIVGFSSGVGHPVLTTTTTAPPTTSVPNVKPLFSVPDRVTYNVQDRPMETDGYLQLDDPFERVTIAKKRVAAGIRKTNTILQISGVHKVSDSQIENDLQHLHNSLNRPHVPDSLTALTASGAHVTRDELMTAKASDLRGLLTHLRSQITLRQDEIKRQSRQVQRSMRDKAVLELDIVEIDQALVTAEKESCVIIQEYESKCVQINERVKYETSTMMEIQELLERLKGLDDELLAKDNSVSETQLMLSCRQRHVRFLEDLLAISQEGEIKEIIHNEQTGAVIKETVHKLGSSGSVVLDIVRRSYSGQRQEYEVELDNAKLAIELQQQQIQVQAEEVQQLVKAYETATQEYHQLTEKITGLKIEVQDAKAHVETTAVEKNLLVRARKRYGAAVETYKHKIDLYSEVLALAEQRATASGTALKNVLAEVWNLRKQGEVLQLRHMTKLQKFRTVVGTANSLTSELTDAKATVTDAKSKISDARSRELSFIERQRQEQAKQTALLTQIAEQKARNAAAVLLIKHAQALQDDTVAALDEDERQRALLSNVKEAQEAKAADETVGEEAQDEPEEEPVQVGRKRKASTSPVEPSNRVKKARKRQR